jgi:CheY-like chemotaxis protein
MEPATFRVLHVEDDRIQQRLVARHLQAMEEFRFEIQAVPSEEEAVESWSNGDFQLVILDYQLREGDGLNCLRRLRQIDPIVPIIALSGTATSEIAAELIEAGADDYLSKQNLKGEVLSQSVRNVSTRARAFRNRFSSLRNRMPTANHTR